MHICRYLNSAPAFARLPALPRTRDAKSCPGRISSFSGIAGRRSVCDISRVRAEDGEHPSTFGCRVRSRPNVPESQPLLRPVTWIGDHGARPVVDRAGVRHRSLLERTEQLAQTGSWALNLRTDEAVWSEGMSRIHGFEPGEVDPTIEALLTHTHSEDRERLAALHASALSPPEQVLGQGLVAEYRVLRADGSVREVRAHGLIELDDQGLPACWVGVARDITDERLPERELQAHYAVSQALREWQSVEEGLVSLLRRLGTALDYPVALIWTCPSETQQLCLRAFWTALGIQEAARVHALAAQTTFGPDEGPFGRVWSTAQPAVIEDVREHLSAQSRAAAGRLGVRSGLAFAAVGNHGPVAVLSFYARERRVPTDHLLRTLTGIGEELGRFLAQRLTEPGARPLSNRELEVLRLAAEGNAGPQIAEQLFLSAFTIKTHFEHIYEKLGVGDRAAAVAHALRTGLIY
jgi:PAS domain S-box-containing protein